MEILFSHGKDLEFFTAAYYHTMFWCRFASDTNSHHNFNSKELSFESLHLLNIFSLNPYSNPQEMDIYCVSIVYIQITVH